MCPVYWVLGSGVKLDVKHFEIGQHSSTTVLAVWPCPGQKAAAVWKPCSVPEVRVTSGGPHGGAGRTLAYVLL